MKISLRELLYALLSFIEVWGLFGFIFWDWYIHSWSSTGRFFYVLVAMVCYSLHLAYGKTKE